MSEENKHMVPTFIIYADGVRLDTEHERAEVRCEGLYQAHLGMRATLKYVGERFSGEYVIERVNHELDANGFITELHLRRNMLPGEPRRASAIDEEREQEMRSQLRSMKSQNSVAGKDASSFQIGENMDDEFSDEGKTSEYIQTITSKENIFRLLTS